MTEPVKPRTYRSPRRAAQADETRLAIIAAARRLFAENGYAATGMTQIATAADVAVQTIYASVGSKRAILFGLLELIDQEAFVPGFRESMAHERDPARLLAGAVALTRRLNERCGDIIAAIRSAAPLEADLAAALAEGQRRHRVGAQGLARRLADLGALAPGLSVDDAGTIVSLMTSTDAFDELTKIEGRSFDQAEALIVATLTTTILGPKR